MHLGGKVGAEGESIVPGLQEADRPAGPRRQLQSHPVAPQICGPMGLVIAEAQLPQTERLVCAASQDQRCAEAAQPQRADAARDARRRIQLDAELLLQRQWFQRRYPGAEFERTWLPVATFQQRRFFGVVAAAEPGARARGEAGGVQRQAGAQIVRQRRQIGAQRKALRVVRHLHFGQRLQAVAGHRVDVPAAPFGAQPPAQVIVGILGIVEAQQAQTEVVGHRRGFPGRRREQRPQRDLIAQADGAGELPQSLVEQPLPFVVRQRVGGMQQVLRDDVVAQAVVEPHYPAEQLGVMLQQRGVGQLHGGVAQRVVHLRGGGPVVVVVGAFHGGAGAQLVTQPRPVAGAPRRQQGRLLRQGLRFAQPRAARAAGGRLLLLRRGIGLGRAGARAQSAAGQIGRGFRFRRRLRRRRALPQRASELRQQRQAQGRGIEEFARRIVSRQRRGRRDRFLAAPQPMHAHVLQVKLIERGRGAAGEQRREVGVGVELPDQVGTARRLLLLAGAAESDQRRPVEALLAVAEVAQEAGVGEQFQTAVQRTGGKRQAAGQFRPVA